MMIIIIMTLIPSNDVFGRSPQRRESEQLAQCRPRSKPDRHPSVAALSPAQGSPHIGTVDEALCFQSSVSCRSEAGTEG